MRTSGLVLGLVAAVCLAAAGETRQTAGQPSPARPVTFTGDIAPLLFDRCGTCHHTDGAAPFSLMTYPEARQRATQIAAMTRKRLMPPWKAVPGYGDFVGQHPLSNAEIELFQRWAADGAPEGEQRSLPTPRWPTGWQLGAPDLVVSLPTPFRLPAGGSDISRVFVFALDVTAVRFVRGLEFRPGSAGVI